MIDNNQLLKIQSQIAHYQQKYQVQQKRIQYLKCENQELKQKQQSDVLISVKIKQQNDGLKKKNRQLKNQLNELKNILKYSSQETSLKTITIKDFIINNQTDQIDLPNKQINDDDIDQMKIFPKIKSLLLGTNQITSKGFKIICQNLNQLKKLFINHNLIDDEGICYIQKLKLLKCLDIRCNKISTICLKYIGSLENLTQLSISDNNIDDSCIQYLKQIKDLQYLDITSNKITQKGGMIIATILSLNNLYLSHNKITAGCVWKMLQLKELKVLDVRFNQIQNGQKQIIKQHNNNKIQLFL